MKKFVSLCVLFLLFSPQSAFAVANASDSVANGQLFCGYLERRIFIVDTFAQLTCAFDPGSSNCAQSMALVAYLQSLDAQYCN